MQTSTHPSPVSRRSRFEIVGCVLKVILPLAVSAGLILWLFHKVNIHQVESIIKQGVDYRYIIAMMVLTVLSHIIRGVRWGIQLRAAGIPRIPVVAESVSIFGAYALNLVFPFLGEAWRCVYITRREGCKLSTVVGTDLGDRASDGIMIFLIIILTLFVAHPAMDRFLDRYPIGEDIQRVMTDGGMWVIVIAVIAMLVVCYYCFRNTSFVKGINTSIIRIWDGFKVLFHMKGTGLYLVLTLGIWICYFFEAYVCFFAFPFTRELVTHSAYPLGLVPGLVVFVFGSCSMAVPSNGGLGPWNIAVMFALSLFGISDSDGAAYSIVCWSFQAIILVATGIFSAFYIMASRRNVKRRQARIRNNQ
ncbi:lysylphosphatidylglycerol synthase transmembrane domain-containing protein [uncultured Duncaniella sp.]|uniref:lysylphosphatidylglycerol synthase transmembrane domain-containing protein n=1 Tax=uncultured Duncaniella sp. TaxID=2768039 RepID=UPI0025A9716F|nr:lysylphosphatidylglycerol synthase transmembrane domain-containing protein [uncultured Duncaniella sp.]